MSKAEIRDRALSLPVEERLQLAQELRDSIEQADGAPVPEWHLEVVAERLRAYEAAPDTGIPWEEVKARFWPDL